MREWASESKKVRDWESGKVRKWESEWEWESKRVGMWESERVCASEIVREWDSGKWESEKVSERVRKWLRYFRFLDFFFVNFWNFGFFFKF